ncbi:MAG TPA: ABC transporter permease [Burkholderiales bacterium]|nr:ABC transporter permease [Burkholderiales bacterium]
MNAARRARLASVVRKELTQFLRDRVMLLLVVYLYTGEVIMCTMALSFDVRNLPTAVADFDRSPQSRMLIDRFGSSGYFTIEHRVTREADLAGLLNSGKALAAVVIPPDFSRRLVRGEPGSVQLVLDGSNANTATVAQGYAQRIVQSFAMEQIGAAAPSMSLPIDYRPRIWYNSQLRYSYFMLLSMIASAGMVVGVITTAASIVREKESGTIEQLMVTPITSAELIGAKMLPTLLVCLLGLVLSLFVAAGFGVPMRGSLVLYFALSSLFLMSSMGVGILVGTLTQTLQQALLISLFALFPILFLSGTMVPLESMPAWLQYAALFSPVTHYMDVLRGIFLKGVGLTVLWPQALAMTVIGGVLLGGSLWRFRRG